MPRFNRRGRALARIRRHNLRRGRLAEHAALIAISGRVDLDAWCVRLGIPMRYLFPRDYALRGLRWLAAAIIRACMPAVVEGTALEAWGRRRGIEGVLEDPLALAYRPDRWD